MHNVRSGTTRHQQGLRAIGIGLVALSLGGCAPELDVQSSAPPVSAAPPQLQRLTSSRYLSTLRTLFDQEGFPALRWPTQLERDTLLHGYSTVGASELTIAPRAAELYEEAALDLTGQVFADAARRRAWVGCEPKSSEPGDDCVRSFVQNTGARFYRRPLTTQEQDEYLTLIEKTGKDLGDPWQGLRFATVAWLQSPHVLYLVEQGEPDPDRPDRLRLTGYELATRLSYLLWNTSPDAELLRAAQSGELLTDEGLLRQTRRLLQAQQAEPFTDQFFGEFLYLDRLDTVSKDAKQFPEWTPQLAASMRGEVLRLLRELAQSGAHDMRELFDTRTTFVNGELASHYGLPAELTPPPGIWKQIELPSTMQPGLLGRAGLLSLFAHATVTSPTLRGKFIRQQLLCQDIPPPPPGVAVNLDVDPSGTPKTMREKLAKHRDAAGCEGCHRLMDPIGLSLEHFGPTGKYRTEDNGLPIDPSGELDGQPFADSVELAALLRQSPRIAECMTRQLYRYATAHLELRSEQEQILILGRKFAQSGFRFPQLVESLVLSEGFRYAARPAIPTDSE